ncbi:hypothetical protein MAHJHV55_52720 [Mycobacterium avium subsp. hominissuis]
MRLAADREGLRRLAADELGLPTASSSPSDPANQNGAVDGQPGARVLAETVVEVQFHVMLLAVRSEGAAMPDR